VVVEKKAPGIIQRVPVRKPLETGVKVVDMLVPLGRGQRELVLGDRQSGKTQLCLDSFVHLVSCYNKMMAQIEKRIMIYDDGQVYFRNIIEDRPHLFYVSVGQRRSVVVNILRVLMKAGMDDRYNKIVGFTTMRFSTIMDASAAESMALQYVAPYSACAMAEY
jgi:F-type H+-transporting ATPase subunit alpha